MHTHTQMHTLTILHLEIKLLIFNWLLVVRLFDSGIIVLCLFFLDLPD